MVGVRHAPSRGTAVSCVWPDPERLLFVRAELVRADAALDHRRSQCGFLYPPEPWPMGGRRRVAPPAVTWSLFDLNVSVLDRHLREVVLPCRLACLRPDYVVEKDGADRVECPRLTVVDNGEEPAVEAVAAVFFRGEERVIRLSDHSTECGPVADDPEARDVEMRGEVKGGIA